MRSVSDSYKRAIKEPIRARGYIQIGLGAISLEAQGSAVLDESNELAFWSDASTLFTDYVEANTEYATLEQNFLPCDGSMTFLNEGVQVSRNLGIATENILGSVKIDFDNDYPVKGITIDFGDNYPTTLKIVTSNGDEFSYSNATRKFVATTTFGEISSLTIVPLTMKSGQARMRIKNILMGVGINFGNTDVTTSSYSEVVSAISEYVPSHSFNVTVLDPQNRFDVDSSDSFINFLEIGQTVNVVMGQTLEDNSIEWVKICKLKLNSWSSEQGQFRFSAVDEFANQNNDYTDGDSIHSRSAYDEAESILQGMGLEPDEYDIDVSLMNVTLTAPMPKMTHKEALQTLCNACRCVLLQGNDGKILIRPNFAIVIEPEDIVVDSFDTESAWSNPQNVLIGANTVYADLTQGFMVADGSQRFLPESAPYDENTGYVSEEIADNNGNFVANPKLSLSLEAPYNFFGFAINFDGNPPQKLSIKTYLNGSIVDSVEYENVEKENYFFHDFGRFDSVVFEILKGAPNNRVLINKISFGDYTDYKLTKDDMMSNLVGTRERTVKEIRVRIFTYTATDDGYDVADDEEYYTETLNQIGDVLIVENPLINTEALAITLAEWLKAYYINNVVYDVSYRGDLRLMASDIIHMESNVLNNLQVAIEGHTLNFNGAWSGNLTMRRALKVTTE